MRGFYRTPEKQAAAYTVAAPAQSPPPAACAALHRRNPDVAGWVRIEGTPIDYPVMYTPAEPERYLRRNVAGKYDIFGVPFLDAACDPADGARGYFIYGHNTCDGTMFGSLKSYLDDEYREAHPRIRFSTLEETSYYEVFAVFLSRVYSRTDVVFKYYQHASLDSEEEFDEYVRGVRSLSAFDSPLRPRYGDVLLTLSTCSHHVENGRLAVVAVRVRE